MSNHVEKELSDYLVEAIREDYLLCLIVTSYTQAKRKTKNLPFGIGKTTLMFWLNYYLNGRDWNRVFETTTYNPYDLMQLLQPTSEQDASDETKRLNCAGWDDVQSTAPATQGVPTAIRKLASFLSTERPECACLLMTAPNINSISAPLRKLIVFEVIVVERGQYEVQKISYHKNYQRPLQDIARLEYIEELASDSPFPALPEPVETRYKRWRATQKLALYPSLLQELREYMKLHEGDVPLDDLVSSEVIRASGSYMIRLPDELGKSLHRQRVEVKLNKTP